jgi:Crp-like helix-turn-helix domain
MRVRFVLRAILLCLIMSWTVPAPSQSAAQTSPAESGQVEERLARWLLVSQDRLGGDTVPLTQEFLAHMLGTRRASVTVAAGILQKAGLITYNRGHVRIENRGRLEDAACECYVEMKKQSMKWEQEANRLGTLPR